MKPYRSTNFFLQPQALLYITAFVIGICVSKPWQKNEAQVTTGEIDAERKQDATHTQHVLPVLSALPTYADTLASEIQTAVRGGVSRLYGDPVLRARMEAIIAYDPDEAFQIISNIKGLSQDELEPLFAMVGEIWSRQDSEAALEASMHIEFQSHRHTFVRNMFATLAEDNPEYAWQLLLTAHPSTRDLQGDLTYSLFGHWSAVDPLQAIQQLSQIPSANMRAAVLGQVASHYAELNPEEAFQWALGLTETVDRKDALIAVLTQSAFMYPGQALELVQQLPSDIGPNVKNQIQSQMIHGLAIRKPEAALELLNQMEPSHHRDNAEIHLAQQWAKHDVYAAFQWLETFENPHAYMECWESVIQGWSDVSPIEAAQYLCSLEMNQGGIAIAEQIASKLATEAPWAATEWMVGIRDNGLSQAGLGRHLGDWIRQEPEEALDYYQHSIKTKDHAKTDPTVLPLAMRRFANQAPEAAAEWVIKQTEEDRYNALGPVVRAWAEKDAVAVREWIKQLPVGKEQDYALETLTVEAAKVNPSKAIVWADKIQDENSRYQAVFASVHEVSQYNQNKAQRMLESARLPDSRKAVIEKALFTFAE